MATELIPTDPSVKLIDELKAVNDDAGLAQIYLRTLCLRAADRIIEAENIIARMAGEGFIRARLYMEKHYGDE